MISTDHNGDFIVPQISLTCRLNTQKRFRCRVAWQLQVAYIGDADILQIAIENRTVRFKPP